MKRKIPVFLLGLFLLLMILPSRAFAATPITKVKLAITAPVAGKTADFTCDVTSLSPSSMKPKVVSVTWTGESHDSSMEYHELTSDEKLKAGCMYTLRVIIAPGTGGKFDYDEEMNYTGSVYINGHNLKTSPFFSPKVIYYGENKGCLKIEYNWGEYLNGFSFNMKTTNVTMQAGTTKSLIFSLTRDEGTGSILMDEYDDAIHYDDQDGYYFADVTLSSNVKKSSIYNSFSTNDDLTRKLTLESEIPYEKQDFTVTLHAEIYRMFNGGKQPITTLTKKVTVKMDYSTKAPYINNLYVTYGSGAFKVKMKNYSGHRIYVQKGTFTVTRPSSSKVLKIKNASTVTIKPGETKTITYKIISGKYENKYLKKYRLNVNWKWHDKVRDVRINGSSEYAYYKKDGKWKKIYDFYPWGE